MLDESQIQAWLAARDGIDRMYPVPRATFDDYLLHLLEVAGPGHVGIGVAWDGGGVSGMEYVSALSGIAGCRYRRAMAKREVSDVLGDSLLRLAREVQAKAGEEPKNSQ